MKTHNLRGRITDPVYISTSNETWHLLAKSRMVVDDGEPGISIEPTAGPTHLVVDGRIQGSLGIYSQGDGDTISVGEHGRVTAGFYLPSIDFQGNNSTLINHGNILGRIAAVGDDFLFKNAGTLEADQCVGVSGSDIKIVNTAAGHMKCEVCLYLDSPGYTVAVNHGVIEGGIYAIIGGTDENDIRNDGKIIGDISTYAGNDSLDLRHGTFHGTYYGGLGDDTLITDNAKYKLTERAGEGNDRVISYVTYTLNENVETLSLGGQRDINGYGPAASENLHGNDGDNRLKGGAGLDLLDGGAGDDLLFGGADKDNFYFRRNYGHDIVADFQKGDVIELADWTLGDDFDDVLDRTHDGKDGAVISFGHGTLTISGVEKADLTAEDFFFIY